MRLLKHQGFIENCEHKKLLFKEEEIWRIKEMINS